MNATRFGWPHLIAAAALVAIGFAMAYSSPAAYTFTPQARQLAASLHAQTLRVAQNDSALSFYRRRLIVRDSALMKLDATTRTERARSSRLASLNTALTDSLSRVHPELAPILGQLGHQIASQDSACSSAVDACQAAKDSLRVRIAEEQAFGATARLQRDSGLSLAARAVAADSIAEHVAIQLGKQLKVTRILAVIAVVLSLVTR